MPVVASLRGPQLPLGKLKGAEKQQVRARWWVTSSLRGARPVGRVGVQASALPLVRYGISASVLNLYASQFPHL